VDLADGEGWGDRETVSLNCQAQGTFLVAVYAKDVAESKATRGTEAGRSKGYPLLFTTEPEE